MFRHYYANHSYSRVFRFGELLVLYLLQDNTSHVGKDSDVEHARTDTTSIMRTV